MGGYIKDHRGKFIEGFYKQLEVEGVPQNSLPAKEHVIYIGALRCQQKRFKKVVVYSDSKTALNRVNGEGPPNNEEIARIRAFMDGESFENIEFKKLHSEANELADALAKEGAESEKTTLQEFSKLQKLPKLTSFMRKRLADDNSGKPYKHKIKPWQSPPKANSGEEKTENLGGGSEEKPEKKEEEKTGQAPTKQAGQDTTQEKAGHDTQN